MNIEENPWRDWIGRVERREDVITPAPLAAWSATLDRDDPPPRAGDVLPPLAHWLYFLPCAKASELGADGHARRGGFLPPVDLPRRMWAGGRLRFLQPLRVGEAVARVSRIADVNVKRGRSGALVFVTVRHEISNARGLALTEEHDIVYREPPAAGAPAPVPPRAPTDETFARTIAPDPVLLFRYSALTFNGHRIHYDRTYATAVEGYPGLVVHGPLIATLLVDLLRRDVPQAQLQAFEFKALAPLFDLHRFNVCGKAQGPHGFALWARDHAGALAMQAHADVSWER
ncbi:MAG TPA: MaoC family dehydratase N-terminal domain-containing protein [Burkholderiaceae bacterium]|nr:MaoC family dehydratase N-terminal domain-containing protein [Burkholderiaceae bacterium]